MHERDLLALIERVRSGALPRRGFIQRMVGLGLSAPMASMLLIHEGIAQTPAPTPYKGTRRGGGGPLKLIWWQGAVHLNPHFAGGTKELDATRIFYEPLGWLGQRRQPDPDAGIRGAEPRQRRCLGRQQDRHFEAEAGRHLA